MNICEDVPAIAQGRELQEASLTLNFFYDFLPFGVELASFLRMVCQLLPLTIEKLFRRLSSVGTKGVMVGSRSSILQSRKWRNARFA
jgi:hypothetical protein